MPTAVAARNAFSASFADVSMRQSRLAVQHFDTSIACTYKKRARCCQANKVAAYQCSLQRGTDNAKRVALEGVESQSRPTIWQDELRAASFFVRPALLCVLSSPASTLDLRRRPAAAGYYPHPHPNPPLPGRRSSPQLAKRYGIRVRTHVHP